MANNRQNLRRVVQAESIAHTAIGEYLTTDGADFQKYPSDPSNPVFPTGNNVLDQMVGDGSPYDKQSKRLFFNPINIPYQGLLTSTMGVRLFRDWLGGAITETTNSVPGTIDSAIVQLAPGAVPLCSNIIRSLGGESFFHGDCFVQNITIAQQGASQPTISGTINNSGYFKKLSATSIDVADVIAQPTYLKGHGVKTLVTFSDGTTSFNFANERRQLDVTFTGNQNVVVENLPGNPFLDTSNQCQGAYSDCIYIDVQTATLQLKVYEDEAFAEFDSWLAQKKLTSVSLLIVSCEHVGTGGTHYWEFEVKIPIGEFTLTPAQQGNFAAFTIDIKAIEGDATSGSLVMGRIRQVGSVDNDS